MIPFIQLLRRFQGLFFNADGIDEADQVPVKIEDRGNGCGHLKLHLQVAHFHVVLRHPDIAIVYTRAESLQQRLAHL